MVISKLGRSAAAAASDSKADGKPLLVLAAGGEELDDGAVPTSSIPYAREHDYFFCEVLVVAHNPSGR